MRFSTSDVFRNSEQLDARLRRGDPARETRADASSIRAPSEQLLNALGSSSISGAAVSADTALGIAAVYSCVSIIAGGIAQLPLRVHRNTPRGSEQVDDHPAFRLLKAEPNASMTAFGFKETLAGHVLLRGNAYARIIRDPAFFEPVAMEILHPSCVEVRKLPGGSIAYHVEGRTLARHEVLHIRGLSGNGLTGLSPIGLLRETFGYAITLQEFGSRTFRNGVRPSGVLEHPGKLSPEAKKNLIASFAELNAGVHNAGKTIVAEENMKWVQIGMSNEDAQFLASRSFSVDEIARIFRVPPHMLGATEKSTSWGTGIEQQQIGFVTFTLAAWLKRIEEECDAVLLTEEEKLAGYYTKFGVDALLRGDFKTRVEGINLLLGSGVLNINEARRLIDKNELPDAIGGIHRVPLNTAPAGSPEAAGKTPANQPAA